MAPAAATTDPGNVGQWMVRLHASSTDLERKWDRLLHVATVDQQVEEWPHGIIAKGGDTMAVMSKWTHSPEVIVIDGGALHISTTAALKARNMSEWGRVKSKATCVWVLMERSQDAEVYDDEMEMAAALDAAMQRRMKKAYGAMGAQRFKWGETEADFELGHIEAALAVQEEEWGETLSNEDWTSARYWEWPTEPSTEEEPWDGPDISGLEVEESLTAEETEERRIDREAWIAEGQNMVVGLFARGKGACACSPGGKSAREREGGRSGGGAHSAWAARAKV